MSDGDGDGQHYMNTTSGSEMAMSGEPAKAAGAAHAASVFLAGPDMPRLVSRVMFPAFNDPARFQVLSMAADWEDVVRDVARYRPEALVLDATLAPGAEALINFLGTLTGTIALVILPPAWSGLQGNIEQAGQAVRGVFIAPPNWAAVASATYRAVSGERARSEFGSPAASVYRGPQAGQPSGQVVVGTRVIAFTSFNGGTGKSSIAGALAVELARHHVRTLLCSFNSPPAAAGHFKLRLQPNAGEWLNRPGAEGFTASLQRVKGLDELEVLMAPSDPHVLNGVAGSRAPEEAGSIRSLVYAAYAFNYGAILLDLPPFADSMWALQPLLASNVAVIVSRPTRHDQLGAIRAYKLLTEQLAQQSRLPPEAIYAVMNFATGKDTLGERDFQAAIVETIGAFPPILTTFPYTPELTAAQNYGLSPVFEAGCEAFARSARSLAGKLIGGGMVAGNGAGEKQGVWKLFGIRVKLK